VCVCVCVCVCDLDRVEFDEVFSQKEPYISVKELCVSAKRAFSAGKKDAFSCSFCTCLLQMADMCDMTRCFCTCLLQMADTCAKRAREMVDM